MDSENDEFNEDDDDEEDYLRIESSERSDVNDIFINDSKIFNRRPSRYKIKKNCEDYEKFEKNFKEFEDSPIVEDKIKFLAKSQDKRFGKFAEEIGFGSYKRVYRGFDFNEGREVAWSSINVTQMDDNDLNRIGEEINIIKKLNHPNIINYVSGWFDRSKNEVVIITEIICGGSLRKHLNKIQNPRLKLIKFWIREILKGLKYLHTEVSPPIVHRDIKCDNIYIDSTNGSIKIGDLGLSKVYKDDSTKSFAGTEEFIAPEVFQGKYTVLADIYSLGMCILEMVTAEKPYKEIESNILKIYESSKNGILPKSLDKIKNEDLRNLIISCLKPEVERPTAEQLLNSVFLNEIESQDNYKPIELCAVGIILNSNIKENHQLNHASSLNSNINTHNNNHILNNFKKANSKQNLNNHPHLKHADSLSNLIQIERNETNLEKVTINTLQIINEKTLYQSESSKHSKENLIHFYNYNLTNNFSNLVNSHHTTNLFSLKPQPNYSNNLTSSHPTGLNSLSNTISPHIINKTKSSSLLDQNSIHNLNSNQNKSNKFSLKNSLNKNNLNFNKFEININEILKEKENINDCKKEIEIVFIVHRSEWQNGKKIKFNFDLTNDHMDVVLRELQKEIGLSENEFNIVNCKLSDFNPDKDNTQKNSLEGGSTTPDYNQISIKKKTLDNFLQSYSKIIEKVESLIEKEKTKKLIEITNSIKTENKLSQSQIELELILTEFNSKLSNLKNLMKMNTECNNKIKSDKN